MTVVACQYTVAPTWRLTNPRALSSPISRRRRPTLTTSRWVRVAAPKMARMSPDQWEVDRLTEVHERRWRDGGPDVVLTGGDDVFDRHMPRTALRGAGQHGGSRQDRPDALLIGHPARTRRLLVPAEGHERTRAQPDLSVANAGRERGRPDDPERHGARMAGRATRTAPGDGARVGTDRRMVDDPNAISPGRPGSRPLIANRRGGPRTAAYALPARSPHRWRWARPWPR